MARETREHTRKGQKRPKSLTQRQQRQAEAAERTDHGDTERAEQSSENPSPPLVPMLATPRRLASGPPSPTLQRHERRRDGSPQWPMSRPHHNRWLGNHTTSRSFCPCTSRESALCSDGSCAACSWGAQRVGDRDAVLIVEITTGARRATDVC